MDATRNALPMPTLMKLSAPRSMYRIDVTLPSRSVASHQANHGAARFFSQNTANSAPRTSLMNRPNSRTVKESIGMTG